MDELPDVVFFELNNGQEITLVPLPPIEEDPRDEKTDAFREALINARLTDEAYIAAMEAVDRDADDYLDKTRTIERALKDTVRALLGLHPRVQKSEINLTQHAKEQRHFALLRVAQADEKNADGRHTDEKNSDPAFAGRPRAQTQRYHFQEPNLDNRNGDKCSSSCVWLLGVV